MAASAQGVSGYFVWEAPGQPVVVRLRLDLVDRLAAEVRRGFGAGPRYGTEVGGILIGTVEPGSPTVVNINDFEPVACTSPGSSYLLTQKDEAGFADACRQWERTFSPHAYAVGYFRSHLGEGFGLSTDDVELMDRWLPETSEVALLIKPATGRASMAAFLVRKDGVFPETAEPEFPLHRSDLRTESGVAADSVAEPWRTTATVRPFRPLGESTGAGSDREAEPPQNTTPSRRDRWMWLPLSLAFLLLGGMLGFQTGLTIGTRSTQAASQEFALSLSAAKSNDNLKVTWNRQASAIRAAQKGVLEIEDGGYGKPVELDAGQLRNGTLIYRNSSNSVLFRLTVYPYGRVSVSETFAWKQ